MGIPHVNTVLDKSQLHGAPRFVLTVIAHHMGLVRDTCNFRSQAHC
jgi:hypothetical protein